MALVKNKDDMLLVNRQVGFALHQVVELLDRGNDDLVVRPSRPDLIQWNMPDKLTPAQRTARVELDRKLRAWMESISDPLLKHFQRSAVGLRAVAIFR